MKSQQVKGLVSQATEKLISELEAGRSDHLKAYLAAIGRFHRYSMGNAMLIYLQQPAATRVAGFHTWRQLGRQVRKGEHGIAILAPIVHRLAKDDREEEEENQVVAFRSAHVFDISQTDGEPLPEFATVKGEPGVYRQRLHGFLASRGIAIEFSGLHGSIQGMSMGGKIVVREDLPPAEEFSVTVHETAHELLNHHDKSSKVPKTVRETEAEAVAFVVSGAIGLECSTAASDYIKLYDGDKKTLLASLERIRQTASEIIGAILCETEPDTGLQQDAATANVALATAA